jgi:hypothetical protein
MWPRDGEARGLQGERRMGTILAFRRDDEAAVPLAKPVSGSLGEIIIFPGVRIERGLWRDKPAETGAPSRRRAQGRRKK